MEGCFIEDEFPLPPFSEVLRIIENREPNFTNPGAHNQRLQLPSDGMIGEEAKGRWTPEEHRLFLEGVMLYGKDWRKMQPLIKTRSLIQIRTHAQKVFKKVNTKKGPSAQQQQIALRNDGRDEQGGIQVHATAIAPMSVTTVPTNSVPPTAPASASAPVSASASSTSASVSNEQPPPNKRTKLN